MSEIASAGFSDQVVVAKIIHISTIQEALSLLFSLFFLRSHADVFARGANLKLRQANARAQAKVARARARVAISINIHIAHDKLFVTLGQKKKKQ